MPNRIKSIDLFAGCGGLTEGFAQTDKYEFLASVEWDKACCETLRKRLRDKYNIEDVNSRVLYFDIQRTDELINGWTDDPNFGSNDGLSSIVKSTDIIVGGPPCQAYSLAGRIRDKDGMRSDYRNYLFEKYASLVSYYKPKLFVFENVPGLLSAKPDGEQVIDKIRETFECIGYAITPDLKSVVFDVADFGVPQHRKRLIILGVSKDYFPDYDKVIDKFYSLMNSNKSATHLTVKEALSGLPAIHPDAKGNYVIEGNTDITWHTPRKHSIRDQKIFSMLADDVKSGKNEYASTESLKNLYRKVTGKQSNVHKYYVLRNNEPSNTIPAHLHKDGLRHIHPDPRQARSITVREAARLQTFPDDFVFCGSRSDAYKMIGNAVPPKFAKIVADNVFRILNE